jgi:lysozyme
MSRNKPPQNPYYYQPTRKYSESRMRVGGPGYGFVHPAPTPVSAPAPTPVSAPAPTPVSAPAPTPVSGLLLITSFEGFSAKAYVDPASGGLPITIGFGSIRNQNGDAFKLGDTITRPEAEKLLADQIEQKYLSSLRKIPYWSEMSDGKQGALLSFAYNLGAKFYGSPDFETITRVLKNKEWNKVPDAFYLYNKASGKVLLGLARRRAAEGSAWKNNTIDEEEIKRIKNKILSELP